jgi:hypothetical protein
METAGIVSHLAGNPDRPWQLPMEKPAGTCAADWRYCGRGCPSSAACELQLELFQKVMDGARPKMRVIGLQAPTSSPARVESASTRARIIDSIAFVSHISLHRWSVYVY